MRASCQVNRGSQLRKDIPVIRVKANCGSQHCTTKDVVAGFAYTAPSIQLQSSDTLTPAISAPCHTDRVNQELRISRSVEYHGVKNILEALQQRVCIKLTIGFQIASSAHRSA